MVMNHYKKPKSFYVRTRVYYTTEQRKPILPIVVGDCSQTINAMAYDVPGGGREGSNFVSASDWIVPEGLNGRIMVGASHQHGGAKYQALRADLQAADLQGARVPRHAEPRLQHDPPDPARAGADR